MALNAMIRLDALRSAVSPWLLACGLLILLSLPTYAQVPAPLALRISAETAPSGGWVQLKIYAAAPALIASGSISMDLDATMFGGISQVAVFSALGDAIGYANVTAQHVDAHFSSPAGGIGQLLELPILAVTVPINATPKPGATVQVTVDPTGSTWQDPLQNPYSVTASPAQFTVGGSVSVESISPGAGLFPAGTILRIQGGGFDATMPVTADGVGISSVQLASPQEIDVTLGGQTQVAGKHFHVAGANGQAVDYFAAPPSAPSPPPSPFSALPGVQPLLPLAAFTVAGAGNDLIERVSTTEAYALLNPNAAPVTVTFQGLDQSSLNLLGLETLVIPPNTLYFVNMNTRIEALGLSGVLWISASAPILGLVYEYTVNIFAPPPPQIYTSVEPFGSVPFAPGLQIPISDSTVSWIWQQGTAFPATTVSLYNGSLDFQTAVSASGSGWLTVAPTSGTGSATLTLTANPSSLKPGNYSATVTVTPVLPPTLAGLTTQASTIAVSLTVSSVPLLSFSTAGYPVIPLGSGPSSTPLTVTAPWSNIPVQFHASAATSSGGNWLSVSPLTGATPATLTVTANPGQLPAGDYYGSVTVSSPWNQTAIPFEMYIVGPPPPPVPQSSSSTLSFVLESGATNPLYYSQLVGFTPIGASIAVSVATSSGGNWLSVDLFANAPNPAALSVNASAVGLSPGTYSGTITVTSTNVSASVPIAVTLTVVSAPTAQTQVTVTPASLSLTAPAGQGVTQSLTVQSGGAPVLVEASADRSWLQPLVSGPLCDQSGRCATPATVSVAANAPSPLGTYTGNVVIKWDTGSVTVPVTLQVTFNPAAPAPPPVVSAVLNAASLAPGAIAPGEIITVLGTGVGSAPAGLQIGSNGKLATTLNDVQLLIDGAAAPLLYASPDQLNAIVPFEAATGGNATIQVISNGQQSAPWDVPLAPSAPSIFTIPASGVGQAAVLNQDNSINGPANPAARGTEIQIFATGDGITSPPGITGGITKGAGNPPLLSVKVLIGGIEAPVEYAGAAPGEAAGVLQVNVLVPFNAPVGSAVPIALTIGDAMSTPGVTIAVR
jgi:uncharacterized protein (TIGR03437 family)